MCLGRWRAYAVCRLPLCMIEAVEFLLQVLEVVLYMPEVPEACAAALEAGLTCMPALMAPKPSRNLV